MSTDVSLRKMTREDLHVVNYIRNHDETRNFLRNSEKITLESTIEWFEKSKPAWLVILENEEVAGYIRTSQDTGESICIGCDIHPDKRRRGYAKFAYQKSIAELYEKGYLVIWLEVFEYNENAISLYSSLGFKEINRGKRGDRMAITMVNEKNVFYQLHHSDRS